MDIKKLVELDSSLNKLEFAYDVCLENGLDDTNRLLESHFKLRNIVRKNQEWRKELLLLLKNVG